MAEKISKQKKQPYHRKDSVMGPLDVEKFTIA